MQLEQSAKERRNLDNTSYHTISLQLDLLPLIKACHYMLVCLSAIASMHIHSHSAELSQRLHSSQQDHNQATTLHCLYCSCKQVGSKCFKILWTS